MGADANADPSERPVEPNRLFSMVAELIEASGSSKAEAEIVADHLVTANLKGHDSHGVIRAAKYVGWVAAGELLPNRHAEIVGGRGSLVVLDGGFGYGQVIGREAMDLVASRTREHGFCAAMIRNSGHLGRIGAWPEQLAEAGLVSMHIVNTSGYGILVAPHGGSDRRLSANPIAAGAPRKGGKPLVLDIATSVIAEGKIQVARNKRQKLKPGQVIDGKGRPTIEPEDFYRAPPGAIFPIAGHKGSGLSVFCEILAGSLSGGGSSHPKSASAWRLVNNMLSIAFDPAAVPGSGFEADVERLEAWVKGSPPIDPAQPVLLPGEIEDEFEAERRKAGIRLDAETRRQLREARTKLGLATPPELAA